jgi:hypothetical protein
LPIPVPKVQVVGFPWHNECGGCRLLREGAENLRDRPSRSKDRIRHIGLISKHFEIKHDSFLVWDNE